MADDIQQKISEALDKGIPMSDIAEHLASHPNPDYQSYGKSWLESATSEPTRKSDFQGRPSGQGIQTGLIDWAQANPQEALMYGAGAYAALQAPKIASKVADYRLKQRELGLKERSLAAYESQVAKQGAAPELLNPKDDLINSVRQNEFDQLKTNTPSVQDQIAQERLKQAQLKTQRAELEHQNWVAKNTLSEAEQAFGRKAKDPAELRLMQTAVQQQAGKGPIAPTTAGPAPMAELPVVTPPVANAPVAPVQVEPAAPAITTPANVVSTGPTPEAVEAPLKEAEIVKKAVSPPPPGMKAQYTKKKGEMGPGGYNWFASQVGHEEAPARWEEQYGKRNVPYEQVQQDYQATRYPPTPKTVEAKSGGAFGKPEYIPEHIRGSSSLKNLAGVAGISGLLMAASSPESKAAMARASEAIKDIGISPEAILRGKGDELGRMGNAYVTAGNPNYLRQLQAQLDVETNPERRNVLLREFQKIGGSGAGRGIAPPSAYMR